VNNSFSIDKVLAQLFLLFAFIFPLSVFAGNFIAFIIIILWLLSDNLKEKILLIRKDKLFRAVSLFFLLHVFGILWTEDITWGLEMIRKMLDLGILFPILLTLVDRNKLRLYIYIFLSSITLIVILSFMIWFGFLEPFKNATALNPTPLMTHITHGPFIAFASYLIGSLYLNTEKKFFSVNKIVLALLFLFFSINVFITGGRTGQVVYLFLFSLMYFQNFNINIKSFFKVFSVLTAILFIVFNTSQIFQNRIIETYEDFQKFEQEKNTNLGLRIQFAINSIEIFKNNPIIGAGTGDFPIEFAKINKVNSPEIEHGKITTNPHNNYLLLMSQFGIAGLISLFYIFFRQFKSLDKNSTLIKNIGLGFIIFFSVICFGDSYLLGHYTSFMFVFFSSFLYSQDEQT